MNYQQTLDYLFSQLPMFHRIGPAAYKADLNNTIALANYLGNPQQKFKSIHIAGTNGKGSVAHMLASIMQQAGYKTGLCTSPHLKDLRERFRINGKMMPKDFITGFVNKHKPFFDTIRPSFFEMTIAMTFDFFAKEEVDIAIIETGLGGRLDSTNIITPELSVITNVSLDHTNLLGNSVEQIAAEKAGIIKPGVPVVVGSTSENVLKVIKDTATRRGSPVSRVTRKVKILHADTMTNNDISSIILQVEGMNKKLQIESPLTGTYQQENICTALATIDQINKQGIYSISDEQTTEGIRNVIKNTGIAGRWQTLSTQPLVICDTGHNPEGIRSVIENIINTPHDHLHFVLGMMNDKDINAILKLLPTESTTYYFCKPNVPRGLDASILMKHALNQGLEGKHYFSVKKALTAAKNAATKNDLVFAGGSTFVVAEIL